MKKHSYIYVVAFNFKKTLLVGFALIISQANAQNNAIFGGGNSDGYNYNCFTGAGGIGPLPIELISFTGICMGNTVVIKWSTASETNNDFFTVERADDAENWVVTGIVKGGGNTTNKIDYSFTDSGPYSSTTYYRLKQTDYNGDHVYSKIISVHNCTEEFSKKLNLFPNPSTGVVHLTLNDLERYLLISINIYNDLGQKVYYATTYQTNIDLSELPNGIYSFLLNLSGRTLSEKIVILK